MTGRRRAATASVLFTVFGGPGIVLVLVPWLITGYRLPAKAHVAAGVMMIAAGLVPLVESVCRFVVVGRGALIPAVPTEHLVVSGFYRYVRNPMYVGVLTALGGEAVLFWSRGMAVEWLIVAAAFELFVRGDEERRLRRTFHEEYAEFCRNVPRWIPQTRPWRGGAPTATRT